MSSSREHEAFLQRALVEHERALIGYVSSILHDLERARDVVQDAFLRLSRQPPGRVEEPRARAWLMTVCRNRAYDVIRKDQRLVFDDAAAIERHADSSPVSPDLEVEREERHEVLRQAVAGLPENQRECVELRFLHDLSYKEISTVTGLTVGNVGFLLHTAMRRLRQRLEQSQAIA